MAKGKSKGKKKVKEPESQLAEEKTGVCKAAYSSRDIPSDDELYDLAELFKIFADTTRIKMLYALEGEGKCVGELAEAVGVSQSAVSHQLHNMKRAHLVKCTRNGKQVLYTLSSEHVHAILAQGRSHIEA